MTSRATRRGGFTLLSAMLVLAACAPEGSENNPGTGGSASGTGGAATSTGGTTTPGTGGAGTGGRAMGTGGAPIGSGGAPAGTGGAATGGATGSGGAIGTGGRSTGGAAGGSSGGGRGGGQAGAGGPGGSSGGNPGAGGSRIPPTNDYSAMGPFTTTTEANTGPGGRYFIYRPQTLGQNGFLHPPIMFGPGTGMEANASQLRGLLSSIASHGFVIIGTRLDGGPGNPASKAAMLDGLNWILQQNGVAGTYQGKLDVTHAVAMGYSVGGTAAVEIGYHQAVVTTVSIHGHTATSALHGPLLQTSATGDTVGLPLQRMTFQMSQVQTFLGIIDGGDHGYIQQNNGGAERPAIIAWLRYWIYNDAGGRNYFYGDNCVMCGPPNWTTTFQRKNWQ